MTEAHERSWDDVAARLRPFIRRRVASEADADDVLQEVLLRVHRGLASLEDEDRLGPWMFRIARTSIADHLRARARHPMVREREEGAAREDVIDERDDEEADAVARDLARTLSFFVALLESPYREAVTLTELEGRTQREAAEMMGISLSGMKSRVQRGRARLRQLLVACCDVALDARGKVIACEPRANGAVPDDCCS